MPGQAFGTTGSQLSEQALALGRQRKVVDAVRIAALRAPGASWAKITAELGLSKGTAQSAFHSLPKNLRAHAPRMTLNLQGFLGRDSFAQKQMFLERGLRLLFSGPQHFEQDVGATF